MATKRLGILGACLMGALVICAACAGGASAASVVYSWGLNEFGLLGDGTTEYAPVFSPVPGLVEGLSQVTALAGGERHGLAVNDGIVEAWGENEAGDLGTGNFTTDSDIPVPVNDLTEATAVAAGSEHSLALLSNGTVEAWGSNRLGQLGVPGITSSDAPVPVSGLSEVTAIAAGSNSSYALLRDGTVMAWGENASGQLGDGTELQKDTPVAVSELTGVSAIAGGHRFALALLANGEARAWAQIFMGRWATACTAQWIIQKQSKDCAKRARSPQATNLAWHCWRTAQSWLGVKTSLESWATEKSSKKAAKGFLSAIRQSRCKT